MLPTLRTRTALMRALVAPLVVALVPLFWVVDATHRASLTTLGRDQGIFQYIAWAVGLGDVDYKDVRDVNGPLVHLLHMVMLALGSADERRFHLLDLAATGLSFAAVGACLPGLLAKRPPSALERAAWAFAAWVVLSGQYHLYLYWNQAQRESFCDWFLLPSLALQVASRPRTPRGATVRILAIAALSTIPCFGKPTLALFPLMQLGVLLFATHDEFPFTRRERFARFALGGLMGATLPLLYLFRYGGALAFARITFVDVPQIYRFIWARSIPEIFGDDGPLGAATAGIATSALLLALIAMRELPRRALVLALSPFCALGSVIAQHKGFDYHFHPLTATTHIGWMAGVVMVWERFRGAPRKQRIGRYAALLAAVTLAFVVASNMKASPHTRNVWLLAGGETAERRSEEEYFATFRTRDFFPWEMRQAAAYLARMPDADARVQTYGMDPYVLFLARRRSATPYIYAYDLNSDAALEGGWSNRPTDGQAFRIRVARDAHEKDMLARLRAAPPEAFLFIDQSPLTTYQDAWEDFRHCCSESATWVATNYHPAKSFGEFHVWIRDGSSNPDIERTFP